jgi:hypothetical protein
LQLEFHNALLFNSTFLYFRSLNRHWFHCAEKLAGDRRIDPQTGGRTPRQPEQPVRLLTLIDECAADLNSGCSLPERLMLSLTVSER